jgi:hypothetical protein
LGETAAFLLLSAAATLFAFACIVWDRSVEKSQAMAHAFYSLSASLSAAALLYSLLSYRYVSHDHSSRERDCWYQAPVQPRIPC